MLAYADTISEEEALKAGSSSGGGGGAGFKRLVRAASNMAGGPKGGRVAGWLGYRRREDEWKDGKGGKGEGQEAEVVVVVEPPGEWPRTGAVAFEGVVARYRPDLRPVLSGVSFTLAPGEMMGVVSRVETGGRTWVGGGISWGWWVEGTKEGNQGKEAWNMVDTWVCGFVVEIVVLFSS